MRSHLLAAARRALASTGTFMGPTLALSAVVFIGRQKAPPCILEEIQDSQQLYRERSKMGREINTDAQKILVELSKKPDSWWDACSIQRRNGLAVEVFSKRVDGAPTIYCGRVEASGTFEELVRSTISGPGVRKQHYDPAVKEFLYLEDYGEGYALQRTMLNPQLRGIISARFSDEFVGPYSKFGENPALFAHVGAGKRGRCAMSKLAHSDLSFEFMEPNLTKCFSETSGLVLMQLEEERWRVWYFLQANPGGSLPKWAVEMAMPSTIATMLAMVQADILCQRSEKAA